MDELAKRKTQLLQAYSRLEFMAKKYKSISKTLTKNQTCGIEDECVVYRDALIKRFEFCYDLTWKFFKEILRTNFSVEVASPKKVFNECYQQNILSADIVAQLTQMVEMRNQTAHVYSEIMADEVGEQIIKFYEILKKSVNQITI